MGEYRDERGIRCFKPDDDANTLHIETGYEGYSLDAIIEKAEAHFGQPFDLTAISIRAKQIQTSCLGYDGHDTADHTDFLVLERR